MKTLKMEENLSTRGPFSKFSQIDQTRFEIGQKLVKKCLDLIFGLPIIPPCALKRAERTFKKKKNLNLAERTKRNCTKVKFILDKSFRIIYTNCSKVLHQMTAP